MPSVKPYRKKGLEHYSVLGEIFNTTTATGQLHYSSSQLPPTSNEERELEENFLNSGAHINIDDEDVDAPAVGKGKRKHVVVAPSSDRRTSTKRWDKMENYLDVCSEVMSQKLKCQRDKDVDDINNDKEKYTIEECIQVAESMGDIENNAFIKMMDRIVNPDWRRIFLTMTNERRRAWLASLN